MGIAQLTSMRRPKITLPKIAPSRPEVAVIAKQIALPKRYIK